MKFLLCYFAIFVFAAAADSPTCTVEMSGDAIGSKFDTLKADCLSEMNRQVKEEIGASLKYLSMAAYFSKDTINRPGFAKTFFEAASEEREHAMKLIEYLSMRGENTYNVPDFRTLPEGWSVPAVTTGESALKQALAMETAVTSSIVDVIKKCEDESSCTKRNNVGCPPHLKNDYHLVDYLTGEFLEEQYNGQKELANHLSTLNKMNQFHKEMGEFLFDKKLLLGE